jgi:hypothetical protein
VRPGPARGRSSATPMAMIEARALHKSYTMGEQVVHALQDV